MTKVFIGGSRKLSRLNRKVTHALDKLIERNATIVIGDANGADKAVQNYLVLKQYRNVVVFCMQGRCRNNLGKWESRDIEAPSRRLDFQFYSSKDLEMARETDYGLMLWDSKSKGTLNNIINLLSQHKPVSVYFSPTKGLYKLTSLNDLSKITKKCDQASLLKIEKDLRIPRSVVQSELWPGSKRSGFVLSDGSQGRNQYRVDT
ncbi:MAG: hypothetical protein HYX81_01435 [Chloroflexi bacterium]|nr:hypothetical protein [Chloroflexota bacterium]